MKKCAFTYCHTFIFATGNGRVDKKKYCSSVCSLAANRLKKTKYTRGRKEKYREETETDDIPSTNLQPVKD